VQRPPRGLCPGQHRVAGSILSSSSESNGTQGASCFFRVRLKGESKSSVCSCCDGCAEEAKDHSGPRDATKHGAQREIAGTIRICILIGMRSSASAANATRCT